VFAALAARRRNRDRLDQAKIGAIAGATAWSGNSKPLEKLEKDLLGTAERGGVAGELQRRLRTLVGHGMVKKKES
jgi:hypothetical protein